MENAEKSIKLGAKKEKETVVNAEKETVVNAEKETVVNVEEKDVNAEYIVTKVVSNYQVNVINSNKSLKITLKSIGGCRENLLNNCPNLHPEFRKYLEASKTKKELFEAIKEGVTPCKNHKTGEITGYSPFFLLQYLHKVHK